MATLKILLRIIIIILATPIVLIGLWLAIFSVSIHFKTEGKITAALEGGYPGADVLVNDRKDFDPANQVCVDVTRHPRYGGPAKREIRMVEGDDDGGTWWLSRIKYSSMRACKKDFSRG